MKKLIVVSAALLLAACGTEEPANAPAEAPVTEAPVTDEAPAQVAADATTDEPAQVVEESAAEPEPEEQTIVLAQADVPAQTTTWQFREGQHYERMVPTQPTVGGADKVEVAEFFWYGCPHCNDVEPLVNRWKEESMPATARFVRIPAMWNGVLRRSLGF